MGEDRSKDAGKQAPGAMKAPAAGDKAINPSAEKLAAEQKARQQAAGKGHAAAPAAERRPS
jgi:hypothetical protein